MSILCQFGASFWGVMSSVSALVPGARLWIRSLQLRLNVAGPSLLEDSLVSWEDSCLLDLRWWSDVSHLQAGLPLGPQLPDQYLFTGASDTGWGRHSATTSCPACGLPTAPSFRSTTGSF